MTNIRHIELAREVGFNTEHAATNEYLHQFAERVRAEERAACAMVCDEAMERYKELWDKFSYDEDEGRMLGAAACSAAIKQKVKP